MISPVPAMPIAMPTSVPRAGGSRIKSQAASPTQMGFVVTSATLLATDVNRSDAIQVAKCTASRDPARAAVRQSRALSEPRDSRRITQASGTTTAEASVSRAAAIASGWAPASMACRISRAAVDTTRTPSASAA